MSYRCHFGTGPVLFNFSEAGACPIVSRKKGLSGMKPFGLRRRRGHGSNPGMEYFRPRTSDAVRRRRVWWGGEVVRGIRFLPLPGPVAPKMCLASLSSGDPVGKVSKTYYIAAAMYVYSTVLMLLQLWETVRCGFSALLAALAFNVQLAES